MLEIFLDSSILLGDEHLHVKVYSMITVAHSSNTKEGGVCIYYKKYSSLTERLDIRKLNVMLQIMKDASLHVFADHQVKVKSSFIPAAVSS